MGSVLSYYDALTDAMAHLAYWAPRATFIGQAVEVGGTAMYGTLRDVPMSQRFEFPVAEDCQMGFCTGLALGGFLPICIFPRINFLLLAVNQLVLHLDKLPAYSRGGFRPRVIIRTAIATDKPLNPGEQHVGDYTDAIAAMLTSVKVVRLDAADRIIPEYQAAMSRDGSTLLVERMEQYR